MKKNEQNVCFEICTFSISAADSDSEDELPPSVIVTDSWCEGNEDLPVYRWGLKHGMATKEAVKVLLAAAPGPKIASTVPTSISKNVLFVVDTSKLAALTDLKCDDMGAWSCTGKKTSWFGRDEYGDVCEVTPDDGVPYKVSRHHYVNDNDKMEGASSQGRRVYKVFSRPQIRRHQRHNAGRHSINVWSWVSTSGVHPKRKRMQKPICERRCNGTRPATDEESCDSN